MRIHLLVNVRRHDAMETALSTGAWLHERGIEVYADEMSARGLELPAVSDNEFGNADLVITFGGDGTLIRAASFCSEKGTPILGVYYGRFGFVTQCSGDEVGVFLSLFFDGKVEIEERLMLQTVLRRNGSMVAEIHSLNEMVLQRSVTSQMMTFELSVDGCNLARYPADGLIVSTPTGSTAYNLSAGGPVLDPRVKAFVVTALAPHGLNSRPFVIAPESHLLLKVKAEGEAVLSADGQYRLHLLTNDEVEVMRSPRTTRLVVVDAQDFLKKLAQRLFWGASLVGDLRQ